MSRWTIRWLKALDPADRLTWAARLFWASILGGILSSTVLTHRG